MKSDRELAVAFLRELRLLLRSGGRGIVDEPKGICYRGRSFVAIVVPNGILRILEGLRTAVSHTAVLHALHDTKACRIFGHRKTICRARTLHLGRDGAERVNVILIPRDLIAANENTRVFEGAIQFFDIESHLELAVEGFTSPRDMLRKMAPRTDRIQPDPSR